MPVERFFLPANFVDKSTVSLIENELQHLKVLRFKTGDELELANGQGGLAKAKVIEIEKRLATLEIISSSKTAPRKSHIILAVPLMRPSKLEWIVEKGTELGADTFIFYTAEHSEKEALSEHQIERLRFLSIAALKQSGRLYLPHLEILPRLHDVLLKKATFLFGDTGDAPKISFPKTEESIVFITGPEKGFSKNEDSLLRQKAQGVRINPNILRAETAPIAAMSLLAAAIEER